MSQKLVVRDQSYRTGIERTRPRAQLGVVLAASAMIATLALTESRAQACVAPGCAPGYPLPASGEVPANQQGFVFFPPRGQSLPTDGGFRLFAIENGERRELESTHTRVGSRVTILPVAPVSPGAELGLEWQQSCDQATYAPEGPIKTLDARVKVGAAQPLPTELGALRATTHSGDLEVPESAMCSQTVKAAYVDLELELAAGALPYSDSWSYGLRVDGEAFPSYIDQNGWRATIHFGGSSLGRGKDRVYVQCSGTAADPYPRGTTQGKHRVSMVGTLPDGTTVESPELEIELRCPTTTTDASAPPPDASSATSGDASVTPGATDDRAPEGAPPAPTADTRDDDAAVDDGCSAGGRSSGGFTALLAGLMLAFRARRSRRRA